MPSAQSMDYSQQYSQQALQDSDFEFAAALNALYSTDDPKNFWDPQSSYPNPSDTFYPLDQQFLTTTGPEDIIFPQTPQPTFSAESHETLPTPVPTPRPFKGIQNKQKLQVKIIADKNKTRAETQIRLDVLFENLDPKFRRVRSPKKTIAKPKYYANEQEKSEFEKDGGTLSMDLFLVLATAVQKEDQQDLAFKRARGELPVHKRPSNTPLADLDKADPSHPQNGGEVIICQGCKEREEKRYNRKKKKSIEDEREWEQYKNDRAIIINEKEYKTLKDLTNEQAQDYHVSPMAKSITLHMRIACYCRHQEEKSPLGYRVIFTFKDSQGKVVTQHMSEIFQITDDHKNKDFVPDYTWNSASAPPLNSVSRPGPFPKPTGRVPPPLVSSNNVASQARYVNLNMTPYSQHPMSTFSQPPTPKTSTFSISPIQSPYTTPSSVQPLIYGLQSATISSPTSSSSVRGQMTRTPSLIDTNTFFPHAATATNFQPSDRIQRVYSSEAFNFQHHLQMNPWDYHQSAPQSCSTTPITQSRPASPSWEQPVPQKRPCYYSSDPPFNLD